MTYEELVDNYRSKAVFIYGKSVVQIFDMETYADADGMKTDFVYHTERQQRGVITKEHDASVAENFILLDRKKEQLETDILEAVKNLVTTFRKETGAAPKRIDLCTTVVDSDQIKIKDYAIASCKVDLDILRPDLAVK